MPLALRNVSIRTKLIAIFLVIKVLPLILLAWIAWQGARALGVSVSEQTATMAHDMRATVSNVGDIVTADSIKALDDRSRQAIERLTTDTARIVANFLYQRDNDIRYAATLQPNADDYRRFLNARMGLVTAPGAWVPTADGTGWQPAAAPDATGKQVEARNPDNRNAFHSRPPERAQSRVPKPLFLEMTFVGLDGRERVKIE